AGRIHHRCLSRPQGDRPRSVGAARVGHGVQPAARGKCNRQLCEGRAARAGEDRGRQLVVRRCPWTRHVGRALDQGAMMDATQAAAPGGWSPELSAVRGHNPYLIAFVVSIATFMEVLDTTIANVALRNIAGGLGVGIDESTYVVTSYLVANAIVLSISGWLSTVIGRKRFYMICVATFAFASLLCGFAWNLQALVLFRILQGLGGGGMATSEQAILAASFPPEKRGQAFAIYGIAVVVAPVIGPTLGGWISDNYSWHWIFLINVPMGLISLFLVGTLVSEPSGAEEERARLLRNGLRVDYIGFALVAVGLGSLEY